MTLVMEKRPTLVRLTLGVVALVGTKLDKTGFSRAWLSSSGSAIQCAGRRPEIVLIRYGLAHCWWKWLYLRQT